MKMLVMTILATFALSANAATVLCTDYKDTNTRLKDLKLEILEDQMIVTFLSDSTGQQKMIYPKVVDQDFKISGFVQLTDVSGAVFTMGVDFYKERMMVHRYIVSGPGLNLVYGQAKSCTLSAE